ncbi:hypothetical protein ACMD2_05917 [Ananas comosus]|uniref:Uncharacterized protein n=1 Tax=Ananas comosus TaxID=4615 RepID=A0A199VH17_ANACO|nr:hypothetical protein ACMD2_05917 [Ananas comosus]
METLVVVAHHRSHYHNKRKSQISDRFASSPANGFKGINCRSFESGAGFLASPPRALSEPKEPKSPFFYSEPPKQSRRSKPISISKPLVSPRVANLNDDFSNSELWAGPTYSNSPPPSSLLMPKFTLRPKRSVSLELPRPKYNDEIKPAAKSAPSSPTGESGNDFFLNTATATENLRRILHLDIADD